MSDTAVVLAQLGGPETLDEVRPFLRNFFADLIPDNIPMPRFLIGPASGLLAAWRADHSRRLYASIGGGSPLRAQTEAQAEALRAELRRRGRDWAVYVAMRNWRPFTADALRAAQAAGISRIIFLPLYPQYSYATTRSSRAELDRVLSRSDYRPEVLDVLEYCEDPNYVAALVDVISTALAGFEAPPERIHLIFSAHGLPVSYVQRGDPYADQVARTMNAVLRILQHPGPTHLSFQSKLGPAKWLEPATEGLIAKLGAEGAAAVCIVPVAFVSEHVETLNEIDIQYAAVARDNGIAEFARASTVQCHPAFIACLADHAEASVAAHA